MVKERENLTDKIFVNNLPGLYENDSEDPIVYAIARGRKLDWIWYIQSGNREQGLLYGYVEGFANESGYFTIDELDYVEAKVDENFVPAPLSKVARSL